VREMGGPYHTRAQYAYSEGISAERLAHQTKTLKRDCDMIFVRSVPARQGQPKDTAAIAVCFVVLRALGDPSCRLNEAVQDENQASQKRINHLIMSICILPV